MGRQLSAFVMIIAALFVGSSAVAQAPAQLPAPSARATQISDDELQTFAKIYNSLQESKSKHEAQLASAHTEEEAGKIRASFEEETTATLSRAGWTADKFNSFVTTINSDPDLAERASVLIKD
jgi:uncharacterized protein DUF4168